MYGLVTSWTVRQKEDVSLQFGCMFFLKKTQAFMVHGKKKCVWSENKFDRTSKRECFFAIWVHGHLKHSHLWYMVEKNVYGL